MKVELEKVFPMPATPEAAWALLQDVPAVAGCMPGAQITERLDDNHYKGTVSVRVGPAVMAFRGEIEVHELDAGTRTLHLTGRGSDAGGSSGAAMDLVARIEPAGEGCELHGRSEVTVSGKAAAFGGRMMSTIAGQILAKFAANFAAELRARGAPAAGPEAQPSPDPGVAAGWSPAPSRGVGREGEAPFGGPGAPMAYRAVPMAPSAGEAAFHANAQANTTDSTYGNNGCAQLPPAVARETEPSAVALAAAHGELNALGLMWGAARDWLREVFRGRPL